MKENNIYLETLKDTKIDKISREERDIINLKLYKLLGKRIERYTMGDSSSVPIEIAEELLKSICFSLNKKVSEIDLLTIDDLEKVLEESWNEIEVEISKSKELLENVIKEDAEIENISYSDTIIEIGVGLKRYDYRFFAHEIKCSIDYQLSNPVNEKLQGIDYINEYLKRLLIENKFCNKFKKEKIEMILNSYCEDYKGLLINIFEPVFTNILGLQILNENIFEMEIRDIQRRILLEIFKNNSIKEIVLEAVDKICIELEIVDEFEKNYIKESGLNLVARINKGVEFNNLDNIFLNFKMKEDYIEEKFIGNASIEDEKLRALIEEIKSCRFIEDKLIIIHNEISSLEDLIEILNNCFLGGEISKVINSFTEEEKLILKYYLDNKEDSMESNTGWEKVLLDN
ncbi:DUF6179 domain-containing protein [uncultured Clostridium sp.]|uniref:DUF6179 domain-containing protein n=1 Tax=uncultured Clostridium sp. TaxID=59620 RepID=UPI00258AE4C6|nr:DUF6179 domain-containing protein [uncultured Clostridium sp.]